MAFILERLATANSFRYHRLLNICALQSQLRNISISIIDKISQFQTRRPVSRSTAILNFSIEHYIKCYRLCEFGQTISRERFRLFFAVFTMKVNRDYRLSKSLRLSRKEPRTKSFLYLPLYRKISTEVVGLIERERALQ